MTTIIMSWGGVMTTTLTTAEIQDKMAKATSRGPAVGIILDGVPGITFPAHIARIIEDVD